MKGLLGVGGDDEPLLRLELHVGGQQDQLLELTQSNREVAPQAREVVAVGGGGGLAEELLGRR
ncbi:MAG: hypothetical protein IPK80_20930 [Nannocystis sp.]|nr:hypothetical protein [Nannocystis sp.]